MRNRRRARPQTAQQAAEAQANNQCLAVPAPPQTPVEYGMPIYTRERIIELTKIAAKVTALVESSGVKKYEQCVFGEIVQKMLYMTTK